MKISHVKQLKFHFSYSCVDHHKALIKAKGKKAWKKFVPLVKRKPPRKYPRHEKPSIYSIMRLYYLPLAAGITKGEQRLRGARKRREKKKEKERGKKRKHEGGKVAACAGRHHRTCKNRNERKARERERGQARIASCFFPHSGNHARLNRAYITKALYLSRSLAHSLAHRFYASAHIIGPLTCQPPPSFSPLSLSLSLSLPPRSLVVSHMHARAPQVNGNNARARQNGNHESRGRV
jgi:hypothetical protein